MSRRRKPKALKERMHTAAAAVDRGIQLFANLLLLALGGGCIYLGVHLWESWLWAASLLCVTGLF